MGVQNVTDVIDVRNVSLTSFIDVKNATKIRSKSNKKITVTIF
jgi:hypothetical protein